MIMVTIVIAIMIIIIVITVIIIIAIMINLRTILYNNWLLTIIKYRATDMIQTRGPQLIQSITDRYNHQSIMLNYLSFKI